MSFQQGAQFRICGRIATKRAMPQGLQVGLSVARREPDPTSPQGWKFGRSDHYVVNIHETAMRAYVETLGLDDLVVVTGEMVTSQFTPQGATRPTNTTRLQVQFLAAVPREFADRIDRESAPSSATKPGGVPF